MNYQLLCVKTPRDIKKFASKCVKGMPMNVHSGGHSAANLIMIKNTSFDTKFVALDIPEIGARGHSALP